MNYEYEIQNLKTQVKNLQDTVIQMARNNTPIVGKVDSTANEVKAITPYTETKQAYIGDTEVVFENVPIGNLSVYGIPHYHATWLTKNLLIDFDALEEVTEITISIS